jgi:hypothetical protein
MGDIRNAYKIFVAISEEWRHTGGRRHKWEGNIKNYLKEIRCEGGDWINFKVAVF